MTLVPPDYLAARVELQGAVKIVEVVHEPQDLRIFAFDFVLVLHLEKTAIWATILI
jgi:hypothetical protein